jgi:hypothetical protein
MYRYCYSKKAIIKDFLSLALLVFIFYLALSSKSYYWATFAGVLVMLLFKDFLRISRMELLAKHDGLYEKIGTKERLVFDWKRLNYVTRTRKFNKFIMLADTNRYYYYLKPSLEGRQELLQEIIKLNLKNRKLQVDERINVEFKLGLQLDEQGKIKNRRD